MWVFGYGSLVWKVDFPYERKLPGRVVTLVMSTDSKDRVWGVAYQIPSEEEDNVREHLNFREKGGYTVANVTFHPENPNESHIDLQLYMATDKNHNYLGPAPIAEIAKQVIASVGPSGENTEYVLNLAQTMRSIAPDKEDTHLYELEKEILTQQRNSKIANEPHSIVMERSV